MADTPPRSPAPALPPQVAQVRALLKRIKVPSALQLKVQSRALRYGIYGLIAFVVLGGGWALWKWQSLYAGMPGLPETAELWNAQREPAIEFVDRAGNTLAVRGPRYGRATDVSRLPKFVPQAFIAAEDKRFYEHDGADEAAIARAVWSNARAGETVSGASTLTQQLIKNLVLDSEQTMRRKAQEMSLARRLEKRMTKDEILSLYLNRVYFGAGLYGIDAASNFYFGKPPEELGVHEAALLAGLPQAPSRLNLRTNLAGARERQAYVLAQMRDLGFITPVEFNTAKTAAITIIDPVEYDPQLGHVLDAATERVKTMLPRLPSDLVITLTIDPVVQTAIEKRFNERMTKDGAASGAGEVAAMIAGEDGRVIALIGGRDYTKSPFNRATQAQRQPGSSFKPFVYAAALEDGYSPYDVFDDRPLTIDRWRPTNYDGGYLGPMTLSEALARSTNTIAAELAQKTSEERVIATARKFGVSSPMKPFPSIALGSQEVTLWDMTRAFGVFQSGGLRLDASLIEQVADTRGTVLYARPEDERARVYPRELAADMTAMLTRVVNSEIGTGGKARISGWTVAGKTGTSQDWRDAWFVGYTAAYTGGVWVGNDDDTPMRRVTGGGLPADLWSDMMEIAHEGKTPKNLVGAYSGVQISAEAEQRISFYRGMAQAFATASANAASAAKAEDTVPIEND
jgi:penicillin-binding protein 1A